MQAPSFIFKNRFNTYYFRQRTPSDILKLLPSAKKEVKISLKTRDKTKALVLARQHKAKFDSLFQEIRNTVVIRVSTKERFENYSVEEQDALMVSQRAIEAIADQQYTQQLFFCLNEKTD